MRLEKIRKHTHIHLEEGEDARTVLRAIAKASFELARPIATGRLHFSHGHVLTDEAADEYIDLEVWDGRVALEMQYVGGRRCQTCVEKVTDGHFMLYDSMFEGDRGNIEPMLERAQEILDGREISHDATRLEEPYKGKSLDKQSGCVRLVGEDDWTFRRRIFMNYYSTDTLRAFEFLVAANEADWTLGARAAMKMMVDQLGPNPTVAELEAFLREWGRDVMEGREEDRLKSN